MRNTIKDFMRLFGHDAPPVSDVGYYTGWRCRQNILACKRKKGIFYFYGRYAKFARVSNPTKFKLFDMKEIVLWIAIFILLIGYVVLFRRLKKNASKLRYYSGIIDSMKSRQKELLLKIEELNGIRAEILTENEQLKEAMKGDAGYVIEMSNREIRSLNEKIRKLEESFDEITSNRTISEIDRILDRVV